MDGQTRLGGEYGPPLQALLIEFTVSMRRGVAATESMCWIRMPGSYACSGSNDELEVIRNMW
eukprot:Clim_evm20s155 gene=Clim_evmTU20s155